MGILLLSMCGAKWSRAQSHIYRRLKILTGTLESARVCEELPSRFMDDPRSEMGRSMCFNGPKRNVFFQTKAPGIGRPAVMSVFKTQTVE
jgi:hypothetical protein